MIFIVGKIKALEDEVRPIEYWEGWPCRGRMRFYSRQLQNVELGLLEK